jgi:hypothetical protein
MRAAPNSSQHGSARLTETTSRHHGRMRALSRRREGLYQRYCPINHAPVELDATLRPVSQRNRAQQDSYGDLSSELSGAFATSSPEARWPSALL